MKRLSRWMPPDDHPRLGAFGYTLFGGLLLSWMWALMEWSTPVLAGSLLLMIVVEVRNRQRLKNLAAARQGEGIGDLAWALDRRRPDFDPWVVRALWDAFGPYMAVGDLAVPLRASDRLGHEIRIDADDLLECVEDVAARAERDLSARGFTQGFSGVSTFADLAYLIGRQPKRAGEL